MSIPIIIISRGMVLTVYRPEESPLDGVCATTSTTVEKSTLKSWDYHGLLSKTPSLQRIPWNPILTLAQELLKTKMR
jgi:hypothetical protein